MTKKGCKGSWRLACVLWFVTFPVWSATDHANTKVTIAGFGGNDVFAMNALVNDVLAKDFADARIDVSYFPVESDYPKYVLNALSSGTAPDAFYVNIDVARAWIATGRLAAFSDTLAERTRGIVPALRDIYTSDGQQYGVPKDLNALALQYNRDVFDDAGVPYPSSEDTWSEFKTKLKAVVENIGDEGVSGLCIEASYNRFAPFAFATGWQPFDAQFRTLLDARFKRAFVFYASLLQDGLAVMPADLGQRWGGGCFAIERTAVAIEGSWVSGYLRDRAPNLLYDSALLPKDPISGEQGNLLFTAGWAINADATDRAAVEKVVALLTGQKAQEAVLKSGLAIPSDTTLYDHEFFAQDNPANRLASTIAKSTAVRHVHPFSFGPFGNGWMEPIEIALSSVLLGQMGVDEALEEAQHRYDQMHAVWQARLHNSKGRN